MWHINTTHVYIQDIKETDKGIIARLQPLNAGTITQELGYETTVYSMKGKVVGNTNHLALRSMAQNHTAVTITGPDGTSYSGLVVVTYDANRSTYPYQTIDTSQDCETPVYDFTMELYTS